LGEFTGGEAPDHKTATDEVVLAASQIPAGGSGSRSHHCHNIERKAQLVGQLISESSTHRMHVASRVKNKIVTISEQNNRTALGVWQRF